MQPEVIPAGQMTDGHGSGLPRPASLCARIWHQAMLTPDHPAVVDETNRLSYADLESQANQLAGHLRELGVGPHGCVAVFVERSTRFVVATLAVLKTGAAYLPLDPTTPQDRLAFILSDSGAEVVLCQTSKRNQLPGGHWQVCEIDAPSSVRPTSSGFVEVSPDDLAYVIYTSGSTGRPKGVEITHGNLANLIDWHQTAFRVTATDRSGQVAGLGFDAAVWEIWPCLASGATLFVADEITRRSAQKLHEWIVSNQLTICFVPTLLAEQLLSMNWQGTTLRFLLTGADTLKKRPSPGLPFSFVNNYGPTECTVVATSGVVSPGESATSPGIGHAITGATVWILDEQMRVVPSGESGELCLAGALVGRGYRNSPEMTIEKFVSWVSPSGAVTRLYRTGDRARILENGEIAFLGRLDDQVKIRGYRIEPGEVLIQLGRCQGVDACAVLARDLGEEEGLNLIAYVVAKPGVLLTADRLRTELAATLPDYMIPAKFVALDALPQSANGKLDRAALPAPTTENTLPEKTKSPPAPVGSRNGEYQSRIGALVASLLGQPSVEPDANFFMLGGHSMFGVQLAARIKDQFGVKLALRQLFGAPTVAALSAEVARLSNKPA